MFKQILIPLPSKDFDPTETAIPWKILTTAGVKITFSTPSGDVAICDQYMLKGTGLGPFSNILSADKKARIVYQELANSEEFNNPVRWDKIEPEKYNGLILPGGHNKGMREYLESTILQKVVSRFFEMNKPVGAICHGVVLAARSKNKENRSVLFGLKSTSLLASQEIIAWLMTYFWVSDYYRTYSQTVEDEVKSVLRSSNDFLKGPVPLIRDNQENLKLGFVVKDKNYLSARWPGDAHSFGKTFLEMIE